MIYKLINFSLNISAQEANINENGIKEWSTDDSIDGELGINGVFYPNNTEFQLNPNTYNPEFYLNPNEVYNVIDKGLILMLGFIENVGDNDCVLGYKTNSGENIFPMKLDKNDCIYLRGADTIVMSQLIIKSELGSTIKCLFTSNGTFTRVGDTQGNIVRDSYNREVVAFL
tara:strand:+ start:3884 stop:4396 length:513 start_codon:yes stop_codon:yes gene_type:complete